MGIGNPFWCNFFEDNIGVGEIPNGNWKLMEKYGNRVVEKSVGEIPNGNWKLW